MPWPASLNTCTRTCTCPPCLRCPPPARPALLSFCRSGVDRLAFSVIWEVTPPGAEGGAEVLSRRFTKSVIRSRAALTYAEAQARIDDARLADELSVSE